MEQTKKNNIENKTSIGKTKKSVVALSLAGAAAGLTIGTVSIVNEIQQQQQQHEPILQVYGIGNSNALTTYNFINGNTIAVSCQLYPMISNNIDEDGVTERFSIEKIQYQYSGDALSNISNPNDTLELSTTGVFVGPIVIGTKGNQVSGVIKITCEIYDNLNPDVDPWTKTIECSIKIIVVNE